jgi:hypothetical protein
LCLVALLAIVFIPLRAECSDDFAPLFTGSSLEHYVGDLDAWSYQDGHLVAKTDSARTESVFLLRQERFGNFILKFQARSDGATLNVLFRSTDMPPGLLLGFETRVGGESWGSLAFRKFGRPSPPPAKAEGGHAAPGFPDAIAMPFFRKAEEVELVHFDSSKAGVTLPRGQWVECEIDGLGNHIMVKVNETMTASYRVDDSFYEKAFGFRLPPQMIGMMGKNDPFYEGMIGFQLPPEMAGKVELKDIQIKVLGDVHWSDTRAAEGGSNSSKESWKASAPTFKRTTDAEWARETHNLLEIARQDEGFRPIFDGKTLQGWSNSASFWDAEAGAIVGQPRNVFLVTDREYSDFILKGSVRLSPPGGNSGVQLRSVVIPDGMRGYQFDMGIPWWGQLFVENSMRGLLVPVGDRMKRVDLIHANGPNDFIAVCSGNHLIGVLNGEVTYDLVDYYGDRTGLIGLQIHAGAQMKVEFKDLKIKELH